MLEKQSIICFAPDPWNSMWRNRHQIMSRLSLGNKVLYIEPSTFCLRDGFRQAIRSIKKSFFGDKIKSERLRHINNGLWVYQHPYWGVNSHWPVIKQVGLRLRIYAIRRAMKKLHMNSPILWVVDPRFVNMVAYFKKVLLCYHVVDNYAAAPYYSAEIRSALEKAERKILPAADLVIVTSSFLREEKSKYNSNVHLVKNAVDYEKFAVLDGSTQVPKDMENIPKPVIGYIGAINTKLDYELLDAIARARPQWSLLFVGEIYSKKEGSPVDNFVSKQHANVHLLGRRDVKDVPKYIHACDICILPYRRDEYTRAIDSLKLYEYFACEKPVVATDIPVIREQGEAVYMAKDTNDFVDKLEEALKSSTSDRRALQRSIAMQNTWDNRVEQLAFLIQSALVKKSSCDK